MPLRDAVYIVGPQQDTDELRYSLRSLAAHVDHDQVYIVGYCPEWVTNVWHINIPQEFGRLFNAVRNVQAATACDAISDPLMLWHDDMFAMRPVGELPVMTRGPITPRLTQRDSYRREFTRVEEYLREAHNVEDPWAYDAIHVPQWYRKKLLADIIDTGQTLYATVYGNLHRAQRGMVVNNAKNPPASVEHEWLSTNGSSFAGPIGDHIRKTFPYPCRYELS